MALQMTLGCIKEMITKQNTYNLIVLFMLVSFGFFGSLSHLFSLALIILVFIEYRKSDSQNNKGFDNLILFFILSSCFFLFIFTSFIRSDLRELFYSLSPVLPIPLIGMLIVFHNKSDLKLSSKKVSQFSQISVFFALVVYILLAPLTGQESSWYTIKQPAGRLKLFSGNPIPFSFCMLGISLFCLADWRNSNKKQKITAFLMFILGAYFATFLSGTRGTFLSFITISPVVIFYLSNNFKLGLFNTSIFALFVLLFFLVGLALNLEHPFYHRIKNGLETFVLMKNLDNSIWQRFEIWSASLETFFKAPIFGHGITERFTAVKPFLKNSNVNYSHPHNDIIAGLISSGLMGGLAVLLSLMASLTAALLAAKRSSAKLYFGVMMSCSVLITANVSTVLFNDITSAWLAFSTYLIWATDFKDEPPNAAN